MADTDQDRATRPSLLGRIRDPADAESWAVFVRTYTPLVYGYCRKRGLQDADAADVAQDVLSQVARSIRGFEYDPARGRFRDWLGTLTRHRLARFFARRPRPDAVPDLDGRPNAADPDPDWDAAFNAQILRAALDRARPAFEPATWRAFELTWQENRPAGEAARETGLAVDAVYAAKSRVLKRLREEVLLLAEDVPQFVPL